VELLKQPLNSPMSVEEQVVSIFAGTRGYLDDVAVGDVRRFESELLDTMRTRHAGLLSEIKAKGVPDALADAVKSFKDQFRSGASIAAAADPTATTAGEVGAAQSNKTLETE